VTADPDPRGLIAEAYRIEGIGEPECRSIFLGWVLGLPQGADVPALAADLLSRPGTVLGHPMTAVLGDASRGAATPRRRGGRRRVTGEAPQPRKPAR
jgi:hypothetical protein